MDVNIAFILVADRTSDDQEHRQRKDKTLACPNGSKESHDHRFAPRKIRQAYTFVR